MIRESNGVGKVEFLGCLGNDVPSGVERQKNLYVGDWGKTLKRWR